MGADTSLLTSSDSSNNLLHCIGDYQDQRLLAAGKK